MLYYRGSDSHVRIGVGTFTGKAPIKVNLLPFVGPTAHWGTGNSKGYVWLFGKEGFQGSGS
jgi:hypothetical protein